MAQHMISSVYPTIFASIFVYLFNGSQEKSLCIFLLCVDVLSVPYATQYQSET